MLPELEENFIKVLHNHTAGDPMRIVKWTNLSRRQISKQLTEMGTKVSRRIVAKLLFKNGFRRRKALKKKTMKNDPERNTQFEIINSLRKEFLESGLPVISIDTKNKELLT